MKKKRYYLTMGRGVPKPDGGYNIPYWIYRTSDKGLVMSGSHHSTTRGCQEAKAQLMATVMERLNNPLITKGYNSHM